MQWGFRKSVNKNDKLVEFVSKTLDNPFLKEEMEHKHQDDKHGEMATHKHLLADIHKKHQAFAKKQAKLPPPKHGIERTPTHGIDKHGLLTKDNSHDDHDRMVHNQKMPKHKGSVISKHGTHHVYQTGGHGQYRGSDDVASFTVVSHKGDKKTISHLHTDSNYDSKSYPAHAHEIAKHHKKEMKHIHPDDQKKVAHHIHNIRFRDESGDSQHHIGYEVHNHENKHLHKGDTNHPAHRSPFNSHDPGHNDQASRGSGGLDDE